MPNLKSLIAFVALASLTVAMPGKREDEHITLGPGPVIPKGCYTSTTTVPNTQIYNCPLQTKCGPVPECIIRQEVTVSVPCYESRCPLTPTVTVTAPASCPTCQHGCGTYFVTTTATFGSCSATSTAVPTYA